MTSKLEEAIENLMEARQRTPANRFEGDVETILAAARDMAALAKARQDLYEQVTFKHGMDHHLCKNKNPPWEYWCVENAGEVERRDLFSSREDAEEEAHYCRVAGHDSASPVRVEVSRADVNNFEGKYTLSRLIQLANKAEKTNEEVVKFGQDAEQFFRAYGDEMAMMPKQLFAKDCLVKNKNAEIESLKNDRLDTLTADDIISWADGIQAAEHTPDLAGLSTEPELRISLAVLSVAIQLSKQKGKDHE